MSITAPEPKANMGPPEPRIDGRQKVTGEARYASDMPVPNPLYAYLLTSAIARGRIRSFDLAAARAVPGVAEIYTHENMGGEVRKPKFSGSGGYASSTIVPLDSPQVWHSGQIIAMVVAASYEAAREAAFRVKVAYDAETPSATFDDPGTTEQAAKEASKTHEDPEVGDFAEAFGKADATVDGWYSTPTQHHNPIELFTTTCAWNGPDLTIYEGSQFVYGLRGGAAEQIGVEPEHIRVVSPFIGGAFGSKGSITPRTALVALAARKLGRPVKLVPTRDQGFTIATYRAETRQHLRLGASQDGKLTALSHEGWEVTSRPDAYLVGGTETTSRMYAVPNVSTKVSIVHADRNTPGFMRAPPETPYMFALESAMDELAVKLRMDPVELRRINDTMKEPIKGLPYSSRSLVQCLDQAGEAFGWKGRNPEPMSMRDGDWLVGWGCASSCYPSHIASATARVRLTPDGDVKVETAGHEIGTGTYTILAQLASERLGVPIEKVAVLMGDTRLPPAPVAGGSNQTASLCTVVAKACDAIRARLGNPNTADLLEALKRQEVGAIEEYAENASNGLTPEVAADHLQGHGPHDRRGEVEGQHPLCLRGAVRGGAGPCPHPRDPGAAYRRRFRGRADHEHPHDPQPTDGRHDLGNRVGAARGDRDRPARRALRQPQHRRVPDPGECRRERSPGHPGAGGGHDGEPARHQGRRRARHCRHLGGARQRRLPCDRATHPRPADPHQLADRAGVNACAMAA